MTNSQAAPSLESTAPFRTDSAFATSPEPNQDSEASDLWLAVLNVPGLNTRQAMREAGVFGEAFYRCLHELEASGHVVLIRHKNAQHLFPAQFSLQNRLRHIALRNPQLAQLHGVLQQRGQSDRAWLVRHAAEAWAWPVRSTEFRLHQLVRAGVIESTANGGDRRQIIFALSSNS